MPRGWRGGDSLTRTDAHPDPNPIPNPNQVTFHDLIKTCSGELMQVRLGLRLGLGLGLGFAPMPMHAQPEP